MACPGRPTAWTRPDQGDKIDPLSFGTVNNTARERGGAAVPEWTEFAVVVGGASGALVGLLFVAISINIGPITRSISLRSRGAQTLVLLVVPLLVSMLLAVPEQHYRALGVESLALVAVAGSVLFILDRRAKRERESPRLARTLDHVTPNVVSLLLLTVAGVTLISERNVGLYLLVPGVLVGVVGGIVNAWLFLTKVNQD
jgi:hypothetical protein